MLIIDVKLLNLAKMQESLLKATEVNRSENLANYKNTVVQIDAQAFADLKEEIQKIGQHNHSPEEEVKFLEGIRDTYNQLFELQLSFKRICEQYGGEELELSNLSLINIEYIENRINALNGYLINLKNITVNKDRIEKLNKQLVDEQKKKDLFSLRLLELEKTLRESFLDAEGRVTENGQLQYTSIIDEYKKLGLDVNNLFGDHALLLQLLNDAAKEKEAVIEELRATNFCCTNNPNATNRQILEEVNLKALRAKYRFVMLKIVELLSKDCDEYDDVKEKRVELLSLINDYRKKFLREMGVRFSFDPFDHIELDKQLVIVETMASNSATIHTINREIAQLTSRTEEMIAQNSEYLVMLADTKELLESTVSMNDIDITDVIVPVLEDPSISVSVQAMPNQVVSIKDLPDSLEQNMSIVLQKTSSVAKRVKQMLYASTESKKTVIVEETHEDEVSVPELVIVPSETPKKVEVLETDEFIPVVLEEETDKPILEEEETEKSEVVPVVDEFSNIFETVVPFAEPVMFGDRTDEEEKSSVVPKTSVSVLEEVIQEADETEEKKLVEDEETMPDMFWDTSTSDDDLETDEDDVLSFDEQITALLGEEKSGEGKVRKLVA